MTTHRAAALAAFYGLSDSGQVRRPNEDSFLIAPALGLAAVADGMGGQRSGDIASASALAAMHASLSTTAAAPADAPHASTVNQGWRRTAAVKQAVGEANAMLYALNQANGHADGAAMGTTLTGFLLLPKMQALLTFHVGDSRLYRLRAGTLELLTRDQTAFQLARESGAPGAVPAQNRWRQAIGPAPTVTPEVALHDCLPGDLLLLCSDGLHGWIPHAELAALLAQPDLPLNHTCAALIALAQRHNSGDNVTALLARIQFP